MKKLTYEYVKDFIESKGYKLLSDHYENNRTKLTVECQKGHIWNVVFNNLKNGQRCPVCNDSFNKFVEGNRLTYDDVKKFIESKGYVLVSDTYIGSRNKLDVICDKGHDWSVNLNNIKSGKKCSLCTHNRKHTYDGVSKYISSEGYTLLSDTYKNNSSPLQVMCPKGHEYNVRLANFQLGQRCPICAASSFVSKGEKQLQEFVGSLGVNFIPNDRTTIVSPLTGKNLELDIWIPSMKKAIEYNGLYWHTFMDVKRNDDIKRYQCDKHGIDLLVVTDSMWISNQEIEMERVKKWIFE